MTVNRFIEKSCRRQNEWKPNTLGPAGLIQRPADERHGLVIDRLLQMAAYITRKDGHIQNQNCKRWWHSFHARTRYGWTPRPSLSSKTPGENTFAKWDKLTCSIHLAFLDRYKQARSGPRASTSRVVTGDSKPINNSCSSASLPLLLLWSGPRVRDRASSKRGTFKVNLGKFLTHLALVPYELLIL